MSHQKQPRTIGGNRLRTLRQRRHKTQLDLELDASLGTGYLQRLELGKVQQPDRATLDRILTALDASFIERRDVLEAFGYTIALALPTESETRWASQLFQTESTHDPFPAYLLDCSHRLLAWNALVPQLFSSIEHEVLMPRLIFDAAYPIAAAISNPDIFFPDQIRVLHYERQRWDNNDWYSAFIDNMRHYRLFDTYWRKQDDSELTVMRPTARLKLRTHHGAAHFRLVSETFAHDPRFRIIHYLPADIVTSRLCLAWQN